MYRNLLFFTCYILFICSAPAQSILSGKVVDAVTRQPLAFVNIVVSGTNQGVSSDIDGKFSLPVSNTHALLIFSYVGYETQSIDLPAGKELLVKLKAKSVQLSEVNIFPGENPADRIIKKATENRHRNNPEKMTSFSYTSYNKFYVTADFNAGQDSLNSPDTTHRKISRTQKLFDKQHLFITESVSKRKYMHPDRNHEEIIGSRTSGMKVPLFTALGNEMQSFSFYDNTIKLFDRAYMNPLVNGTTSKYLFLLEDTLYSGKDSIFVLSFRPKRGKKFDALKGVIYINTNGYAVQNVIAEPDVTEGLFTIKIQQKYELIEGKQWFPVQLNTDLYYNDFAVVDSSVKIIPGEGRKQKLKSNEGKVKIVSRSYIRDIELNPPLHKREFGSLETEIATDATEKDETFWKKYRVDSLSLRDQNTYHVIDSIGKAQNLDFKLKALGALVDGQLPWKYICFDLNRFLDFNAYEQVRLGAGIHSSDRVSRYFSVGGYGAYGWQDKAFKYGYDISVFPYPKNRDFALTYAYSNDIVESGGISFLKELPVTSGETFRTNLLSVYDKQEMQKISLRFRALNYFLCNLYFSDEERDPLNTYRFGYTFDYGYGVASWNRFFFTEGGFQVKYIYREKFAEFLDRRVSQGSDYPVVYFNFAKGFNTLADFNGAYDYTKYELKCYKQFVTAKAGKPSFEILAGYVNGNIPYTKLFAGRGSFVNYTVTVPNTFETMGINEFLSDRYAALFYTHDFGRLFFRSKYFQPQVLFVNRVGFGFLSHPESQFGITYKTMEKGYYETGLLLNNLIRKTYYGFGAGLFYRYGPYAFADETKNLAVKFSFTFNF
jgi:hypothetical protein